MNVLEISGKLNIGGAQAVAANIAKFAPEKYRFVYVVFGDDVGEYEAAVAAKGNKIVHIPSPSGALLRYFRTLVRIMREERIDVVHCHTMFNCGVAMLAAKYAGVKGRISHSHTIRDDSASTVSRNIYKWISRQLIYRFGTDYLACGVDAGNILYGEKWFSRRGRVIRNGIEIERYRYDSAMREKVRAQYGWEDSFVIGHVGHYVNVKNQRFLIERMPAIRALCPRARLVMFGDGPDRGRLQKLIDDSGAAEYSLLAGNVSNVNEILSGLDVFAFPSLYEGTPLALIEAQANGLPCVISDAIPADACLTDAVEVLPLGQISLWEQRLAGARRRESEKYADVLMECYGDLRQSMRELYEIFDRYETTEV